MDQFIVSSKTIPYLSSKHMFDADAALDDKPYKILFVLCLKQISKKFRFFYNNVSNLVLNCFVNFLIDMMSQFLKL